MVRKLVFVVVASGLVGLFAQGCAGDPGKGEGDSCSGVDDCYGNLICQPVYGRTGDFCCPAPADASSQANCQAVQQSNTGSSSGSTPSDAGTKG